MLEKAYLKYKRKNQKNSKIITDSYTVSLKSFWNFTIVISIQTGWAEALQLSTNVGHVEPVSLPNHTFSWTGLVL